MPASVRHRRRPRPGNQDTEALRGRAIREIDPARSQVVLRVPARAPRTFCEGIAAIADASADLFLWALALIAWNPIVLRPLERLTGLEFHFSTLCGSAAFRPPTSIEPSAVLALIGAAMVWLAGNAWMWRRREA